MTTRDELEELKNLALEAHEEYQDSLAVIRLAHEASSAAMSKAMEAKTALDRAVRSWADDTMAPPPAA